LGENVLLLFMQELQGQFTNAFPKAIEGFSELPD